MMATRLGDHRFDDQLDDLSPAARQARLDHDRTTLADLPARSTMRNSPADGQIDYEILRHHLERTIWLAETFHPFEDDPRIYGEYLTESVYLLLTQSSLPAGDQCQERPVADGADSGRGRGGAVDDQEPRLESRSRPRSVKPRAPSRSMNRDILKLASAEPDRIALSEKARPIAYALQTTSRLPQERGTTPLD